MTPTVMIITVFFIVYSLEIMDIGCEDAEESLYCFYFKIRWGCKGDVAEL